MYTYRALITRVVDGDTFEATVDLGFDLTLELDGRQSCRLMGVNTPEVYGAEKEAGLAAKARVQELIEGRQLVITTYRDDETDKYGRYLADVTLPAGGSLADLLVAEGHAAPASY